MMSDHAAVLRAISEAQKALKDGDRRAARRWAEQAVFWGRDEEDAWLVLAQTSNPRAKVAYLEEALKINPGSPEANAAMHSAKQWLNAQPNHKMEVWKNASAEDAQIKRSGKRKGTLFCVSISGVLVVFTLGVAVWLSLSGSFRSSVALIPRNIKTQTFSKGVGMNTPTTTRSIPVTSTMAPLQPATQTPSPTPTPAYIFIPALANLGIPTSNLTPLPPLTTTESSSPTSTPLTQSTKIPFARKTILVDISDQRVYAYDGGKLIFSFVASTGRNDSTQVGHYRILDKSPNAYSDPWRFWMPYWMGIYYVGYNLENGFHSLPVLSNGVKLWNSQIGSPITYGCVVLRPNDMKELYFWAGIGTAVVIRR
jgi:lipoprotein-anchoring transpeptidase ErfK/SrfK